MSSALLCSVLGRPVVSREILRLFSLKKNTVPPFFPRTSSEGFWTPWPRGAEAATGQFFLFICGFCAFNRGLRRWGCQCGGDPCPALRQVVEFLQLALLRRDMWRTPTGEGADPVVKKVSLGLLFWPNALCM